MNFRQVWIVDFGSQYTQLITRKTRELGFSAELLTLEQTQQRFSEGASPNALILSGGPQSVFEDQNDYSFLFNQQSLPVLGICYGMQILGQFFKGEVTRGVQGEYGPAVVQTLSPIKDCPNELNVWMSHSDNVSKIPPLFDPLLKSKNGFLAGIRHQQRPILGLQFHPEVEHTPHGKALLTYFFEEIAHLVRDWSPQQMLEEAETQIRAIGQPYILCAFSGGVDSLVCATLVQKIHGNRLFCFFVDHGLLRPQDSHHIALLKEQTPLQLETIDAKDYFQEKLKDARDPEEKRKIIGRAFIEVFEQKVHDFEVRHQIHFEYLLQGTLYPDVIESISPHKKGGKSVTIKSHHNVGGLPERMKLTLLEPLRYLFKDEARLLGKQLQLKEEWIYRHPFPGPGIGIRVLGKLSQESIRQVQQSDQILFEELHHHQLYRSVWQAFTVLLPVQTVGVKGDVRAYEQVIALRIVNSSDGMTAGWSDLPHSFLSQVSARITNEVKGITRVVYDITSKPPGTIEWE